MRAFPIALAAALLLIGTPALAQQTRQPASQEPTSGVEATPKLPSYVRSGAQDSVLNGGSPGGLPNSQITLPPSGSGSGGSGGSGGGSTPPTSPWNVTLGDWDGKFCFSVGAGSHDATAWVTLTYNADGTWLCSGKGGPKASGVWLTAGGTAADYELKIAGRHSWSDGDCVTPLQEEPVSIAWGPVAGVSIGASAHGVSVVGCQASEAIDSYDVTISIRKKDGSSEQNGDINVQANASAITDPDGPPQP